MRSALRPTSRALALALLLVVAAACGSSGKSGTADSSGSTTSGGTSAATDTASILAPPAASGKTVHGIKCEGAEQLAYHIHAHLAIYVNGKQRLVPMNTGIDDDTCIYWLHTHDTSGVLHVESPDSRTFVLGDFFAVWQQPLSATQVGPAKGAVTAYVNGKPFKGDPSTIKLEVHTLIQLDVGTPAPPPQPFSFPQGL